MSKKRLFSFITLGLGSLFSGLWCYGASVYIGDLSIFPVSDVHSESSIDLVNLSANSSDDDTDSLEVNYLEIPDTLIKMRQGDTISYPVVLVNASDNVVGMQFNAVLPQGLDFALNKNGTPMYEKGRRLKSMNGLSKKRGDRIAIFLIYSQKLEKLPGNKGELIYLKLIPDSSLNKKECEIVLNEIVISDRQGHSLMKSDTFTAKSKVKFKMKKRRLKK